MCQGSKYAQSSYMFDKILKMSQVLKKQGCRIWHGCLWKGDIDFRIFLIMVPYTSIIPKYVSILLIVPDQARKCLNELFSPGAHQRVFRTGEILWNQGTSINFLSKTQEKKRSHRQIFWSFFFQIILKLHFEWKIQAKDGHSYILFSPQHQGTLFSF